jgi:hypothetical protein
MERLDIDGRPRSTGLTAIRAGPTQTTVASVVQGVNHLVKRVAVILAAASFDAIEININ